MHRSRSKKLVALLCAASVGVAGLALSASAVMAQAPAPSTPAASKASPATSTTPATAPTPAVAPAPPAVPAAPAAAPPTPPPPLAPRPSGPSIEEIVRPVNSLQTAIEAAEKNLEQSPGSQRDLATLRTGIEKIENNAKEAVDDLRKPLDEVRSQIAKLGAPPAANEPPEEPDVAAERQCLNGIAAQIDGAIKKASLIEVRARQLVSRVQTARQGIFTRFLFRQTDTPLQWSAWKQAGDQLHLANKQIRFILGN